eukprot:1576683-Alexandrium_andersonii.AAC.1
MWSSKKASPSPPCSASEGHGRRGETVEDHHGRSKATREPAQFAVPPGSLARVVGRDHGRPGVARGRQALAIC